MNTLNVFSFVIFLTFLVYFKKLVYNTYNIAKYVLTDCVNSKLLVKLLRCHVIQGFLTAWRWGVRVKEEP